MQETENILVLASASPRRREILEEAGIRHIVRPADIDESVFEGIEPRLMVQLLAASKAAAAAKGEEGLAVEDVPAIGEVSHREELERKGQFYKGEHHLHGIHPATALGGRLDP